MQALIMQAGAQRAHSHSPCTRACLFAEARRRDLNARPLAIAQDDARYASNMSLPPIGTPRAHALSCTHQLASKCERSGAGTEPAASCAYAPADPRAPARMQVDSNHR